MVTLISKQPIKKVDHKTGISELKNTTQRPRMHRSARPKSNPPRPEIKLHVNSGEIDSGDGDAGEVGEDGEDGGGEGDEAEGS
ncbi:unnamed protein product [Linum trigynum]|uniref:Uncharacterized protein n=1 Tax=Linum trigynum TaxID=586398 RepID=A0AAV2CUF1_9ROSI